MQTEMPNNFKLCLIPWLSRLILSALNAAKHGMIIA